MTVHHWYQQQTVLPVVFIYTEPFLSYITLQVALGLELKYYEMLGFIGLWDNLVLLLFEEDGLTLHKRNCCLNCGLPYD